MPQALLSFLAMMVLMLFSMQQQKEAVEIQKEIISTEMEVAAGAVAAEKVRYLLNRKFDPSITSGNLAGTSPSSLRPESDFGKPSEECWSSGSSPGSSANITGNNACSSVGDYHKAKGEANFAMPDTSKSFTFRIEDTIVRYVCENGSSPAGGCPKASVGSQGQTFHKDVTVVLTNRYMRRPVSITRRFSPLK